MKIEEIKELYWKFESLYNENEEKLKEDSYLCMSIKRFLKEYQNHINWLKKEGEKR